MAELLINGLAQALPLRQASIDCVVTSPPYFGLRDYGVDGQLGLEETPERYIERMVSVFREVWRVLKPWGTLWLNMGDSYAGSGKGGNHEMWVGDGPLYPKPRQVRASNRRDREPQPRQIGYDTYKPKDLMGIPWMLAFALRADGWYLRSDIIWAKPNPMPESVTDRPTKSHEYLFLLTKQPRYFYDQDAIREPIAIASIERISQPNFDNQTGGPKDPRNGGEGSRNRSARQGLEGLKKSVERQIGDRGRAMSGHSGYYDKKTGRLLVNPAGRNKWTVWNVPTQAYSGAHFATFPQDLIEPCIKAGTSEKGVCPECGRPWERVVEIGETEKHASENQTIQSGRGVREFKGWQPTCEHDHAPVPATVFDPFMGSGTTALVAKRLGRHAIGTDINLKYLADLAYARVGLDQPTLW